MWFRPRATLREAVGTFRLDLHGMKKRDVRDPLALTPQVPTVSGTRAPRALYSKYLGV